MQKLDPKSVWLFFYRFLLMWFILTLAIVFSIIPLIFRSANLETSIVGVPVLFIAFFLLLLVFSYWWATLSYNNFKYELSEEGFKKESGVLYKKYVTIPYDRIQNVDIYRGILSRILGLSDLHVQTAGMSYVGKGGAISEGRLPGLSAKVAEEVRSELIHKATSARRVI